MPFTPFHMGPGCVLKAVTGGSMSLVLFGMAQIAVDLQPLYHLLRGEGPLHGISHTLIGATVLGTLVLLAGKPLAQWAFDSWRPEPTDRLLLWLRGPKRVTWLAAATGAYLGTFSHVLLDSLVHSDVQPFYPFITGNPLVGVLSFLGVELLCLGMGLLGMLGMGILFLIDTSG